LKKTLSIFIVLICSFYACKKDTINTPGPITPERVVHKVSFVFVNRIGFRNDSTHHGINDTVFQGPCLDGLYYDKKKNVTTLSNTCYNRNFPTNNYPTADSIIFRNNDLAVGDKYAYQVEMIWKCPTYPYTTKVLRYNTKNYFTGSDTIKYDRDTVIKFIWPKDTNSGKYIKTYQFP
jgi:hypothetical protein